MIGGVQGGVRGPSLWSYTTLLIDLYYSIRRGVQFLVAFDVGRPTSRCRTPLLGQSGTQFLYKGCDWPIKGPRAKVWSPLLHRSWPLWLRILSTAALLARSMAAFESSLIIFWYLVLHSDAAGYTAAALMVHHSCSSRPAILQQTRPVLHLPQICLGTFEGL